MTTTADDWHEVYTPSPVVVTQAEREMAAAQKIAAWMDTHAEAVRRFVRNAREEDMRCPDCGGANCYGRCTEPEEDWRSNGYPSDDEWAATLTDGVDDIDSDSLGSP